MARSPVATLSQSPIHSGYLSPSVPDLFEPNNLLRSSMTQQISHGVTSLGEKPTWNVLQQPMDDSDDELDLLKPISQIQAHNKQHRAPARAPGPKSTSKAGIKQMGQRPHTEYSPTPSTLIPDMSLLASTSKKATPPPRKGSPTVSDFNVDSSSDSATVPLLFPKRKRPVFDGVHITSRPRPSFQTAEANHPAAEDDQPEAGPSYPQPKHEAVRGIASRDLAEALSSSFKHNDQSHRAAAAAQAANKQAQLQDRVIAPLPGRAEPAAARDNKSRGAVPAVLDRREVPPEVFNAAVDRGLETEVLPYTFRKTSSPYAFKWPELGVLRYADRLLSDRAGAARGKEREQAWMGSTMLRYSEAGKFKLRLDELFGPGDMLRQFGSTPRQTTQHQPERRTEGQKDRGGEASGNASVIMEVEGQQSEAEAADTEAEAEAEAMWNVIRRRQQIGFKKRR